MKKYLSFILLLNLFSLTAQSNIIRVDFTARRPFPIYFESYTSGFDNVTITLTNVSPNDAPEFITLASLKGPHGISGLSNESWCTKGLRKGAVDIITYQNYDDLCLEFPISNLELRGLPDEVAGDLFLRHIMPEGMYEFCLIFKNYATGEEIGKGCLNFEIVHPDRPKIVQPIDNDFFDGTTNVIYPISWMHNIPDAQIRTTTSYRLVVKDLGVRTTDDVYNPVFESYATIYDAMLSPEFPTAFTEDQLTGTSFNLPVQDMQMEGGHYYGLMIIAENDEFPFSADASRSDVVVFEYGGPFDAACGEGLALTSSYPTLLETVPLTKFPIMAAFEPYCDQYREYRFHAVLREMATDAIISDFSRTILWNSGPRKYLNYIFSQNNLPFTDEDGYYSSQIPHQDVSQLPILERGKNYIWTTSGNMIFQQGRRKKTLPANMLPSGFTVGMPVPKLQSPIGGDSVEAGLIHFDISYDHLPTAPIPPIRVMQVVDEKIVPYELSPVNETAVIQVSSRVSFDTLVFTMSRNISYDLNNNTDPNDSKKFDVGAFNEAVYGNYGFDSEFQEPGTYYWRVAWLKSPESLTVETNLRSITPDEFYHMSPVDSFLIADTVSTTPSPAVTQQDTAGCGEQALYTEAIPTTPISEVLAQGDEISVGKFVMEITEITKQNNLFTGKGRIKIPFLKNIVVKTTFSNIRINSLKRVYEGHILTEQGGNELESISNYILNQPFQTPIGWDTTIAGQTITLAIKQIKFESTVATMQSELNWSDALPAAWEGPQWPIFGNEIEIHPGGFSKSFLLYFQEDVVFDEDDAGYGLSFKGGNGEQDSSTMCYIQWGCRGFEGLQLAGKLAFDDDFLKKDSGNDANDAPLPGRVNANFLYRYTRRDTTSGFLIKASMDPFQFDSFDGWGFRCDTVYIDYSDFENPPGFSPPPGFHYPGMDSIATRNTWQGVYVPNIQTFTPKGWGYSDKRTGIFGGQAIFSSWSNYAFTLRATNVLSEGLIARMQATIDTVEIKISSQDKSARMNGKLTLPMCSEDSYLKYSGFYSGLQDWNMSVRVGNDSLTIPAMIAKIVLSDNSSIVLGKHPDSTTWKLNLSLHGYMTINSDYQPARLTPALSGIDFKRMEFQDMGYESGKGFKNKPVFRPASPEKSLNGFPVQLDSIDFLVYDGNPALYFKPKLNLVGDVNGFSVAAGLIIAGEMDFSGDRDFLNGGDITLSDAEIDVKTSGFELSGRLRFINTDQDKGLEGVLAAKFPSNISATVRAKFGTYKTSPTAVFNTANYYSYWFADALVTFGANGIPLFAGVNMYGVGGGLWYNMRQDTVSKLQFSKLIGQQNQNTTNPQNSGIPYTRQFTSTYGFKVQGLFGSPNEGSVYNMMLAISAQFNPSGGPNVSLKGDAYFMSKITNRKPDNTVDVTKRSFWGTVEMNYNGQEHFIDGTVEAFAQIRVNDHNLIYGMGPGYRVAQARFHAKTAGENFWYFKIGEPQDKAGIVLDAGKALTVQSYLMVGMGLPAMLPEPDPTFLAMMNTANSSYTSPGGSYENVMNKQVSVNGSGFAVGVTLKDSLDKKFTPFYFKAQAVIGADINITSSSERVCAETNEPPGINSWYAQGQMYAGLSGDFGIHIDVLIFEGNKSLFSGSIASIMTGGLPNPTWFECKGRMRYNVLGLVEGSHSFQFGLGDRCTIGSGNPFAASPLITDMLPNNGATDVSIFTSPEAAFSLPMNKRLEFYDDKLEKLRIFKAIIRSKSLIPDGYSAIPMNESWEPDGYTARFPPTAYLRSTRWHTYSLEVGGKEITSAGEVDITENGVPWKETKTVRFQTGVKPDSLSPLQVALTYPISGQNYFMKSETDQNKGFISLTRADNELFYFQKNINGNNIYFKYVMNFIPLGGGDTIASPVQIEANQVLRFDVSQLDASKKYVARLFRRLDNLRNTQAGIMGDMVMSMGTSSSSGPRIGSQSTVRVTVADKYDYTILPAKFITLASSSYVDDRKQLYQFVFGTSKFNSLEEKLASASIYPNTNTDQTLFLNFSGMDEGLDVVEASGYKRQTDTNIFTNEASLISKGTKRFRSTDDVNLSPFEYWDYDPLWDAVSNRYYKLPLELSSVGSTQNLKTSIPDNDLYKWSPGNSLRPLLTYASMFPTGSGPRGSMVIVMPILTATTVATTSSTSGPGFAVMLPYGPIVNNHLTWNKTKIQQKLQSSIPWPGPKPGIYVSRTYASILQDTDPQLYQRMMNYLNITSFNLPACVQSYMGFGYNVPSPLYGGRRYGTTSKKLFNTQGKNCR